eukprot:13375564-Alexandrium_andersonii.AAC.1
MHARCLKDGLPRGGTTCQRASSMEPHYDSYLRATKMGSSEAGAQRGRESPTCEAASKGSGFASAAC